MRFLSFWLTAGTEILAESPLDLYSDSQEMHPLVVDQRLQTARLWIQGLANNQLRSSLKEQGQICQVECN